MGAEGAGAEEEDVAKQEVGLEREVERTAIY